MESATEDDSESITEDESVTEDESDELVDELDDPPPPTKKQKVPVMKKAMQKG